MPPASLKTVYLRGLVAGAPFLLVVLPFALLFGVVAAEAGLPLVQVMGFSVLVVAGASQFTALQLMGDGAPTLVVLATALAVNLRMAMYSASLAPHLGAAPLWQRGLASYLLIDQGYAVSVLEYERRPEMSVPEKMTYYFGTISAVVPAWYALTFLGAVAGTRVPEAWALDFAMPICFLAMIAPALRTMAHVAAAGTSILLALALAALPYSSGLLIAALGAMVVGAEVERRMNPA